MDSSLDEFNFTDDEIREQLELLGFKNVTASKFQNFKKDLRKLIHEEKSSEESQIFNDELNKIKREKLSDNPYLWDEYDDDDYDDVGGDGDDDQSENDYAYGQDLIKPSSQSQIKPSKSSNIQKEPNYYKSYLNKLSTKPNISTSSSTASSNVLSYNRHNDIDKYKKSLEKLHETNAYIKRKISRKLPNGSSKISSNYVKSSPSHSLVLEDNFSSLNINSNNANNNHDDDVDGDNLSEHSTIVDENDFEDVDINRYECKTDLKNYDNDEKVYKVKSFIRSQSSLSTRFEDPSRLRKNNPVNRYHEYSKLWKKQKAPGEKSHSGLRWSIREKMLDKHVIVKKQPSCQPTNNYIIPTDKKRQDLRWIVRNALANNVSVSK